MNYLGEYRYGTEILQLPKLGNPFKSETQENINRVPPSFYPFEEDDPSQRYWFRWITGHQIMLTYWHLLGKLFENQPSSISKRQLELGTQIFKSCSVIFEYTGSCPKDFYHTHIRSFMALFHRGFSGLWASDYKLIPQIIKKVATSDFQGAQKIKQKSFMKAYQINLKSHIVVAKKLVPEGASLLKKAKKEGVKLHTVKEEHAMLYDFFFLINRQPTSRKSLIYSLEKRTYTVIDDIKSHPLPNSSNAIAILEETLTILKRSYTAQSKISS